LIGKENGNVEHQVKYHHAVAPDRDIAGTNIFSVSFMVFSLVVFSGDSSFCKRLYGQLNSDS
jgi:hypothetical protein